MTIPFLLMLITLAMWFVASAPAENVPWWRTWFIDVCRVLFIISAAVVIYSLINKSVI